MLRYLSVCSGIEAATVAWEPLGWRPWAFSEIDAFPAALLEQYHPDVPNLGDMTNYAAWPDASLDVLVGGTPCQSFSVAGLGAGLADPRGGLMLTYLEIARRYRPRWVVWENVPGVLSNDDGRAFGSLLGGVAKLGYGFAYRVLDAQFFRVAQRRRRVFVVGHLGDWRRAAAVLFERASLSGHPAPRREAGQDVAGTIGSRTARGGMRTTDLDGHGAYVFGGNNTSGAIDVAPAVLAKGGTGRSDFGSEAFVAHALRGEGFDASEDGTGRGTPLVPVAFDARQSDAIIYGDTSGPLDTHGHTIGVLAFSSKDHGADVLRRLTPRECERLQGFPDDYTLISYRGKPASDGPRYKALGNSMAVPVMRWIGERIAAVEAIA